MVWKMVEKTSILDRKIEYQPLFVNKLFDNLILKCK